MILIKSFIKALLCLLGFVALFGIFAGFIYAVDRGHILVVFGVIIAIVFVVIWKRIFDDYISE